MTSEPPMSPLDLILRIIDQGFDAKSWHGPTLRGSIRGLDVATASFRPAPGRHNVWEIVVHTAYWKYIVRRRLLGEKRGSFSLKGSNWFPRPLEANKEALRKDIALLDQAHRELREAVGMLRPADLAVTPSGSKVSNLQLLTGIAAHDVYHAGQIQLLKRLAPGLDR